MACDWILNERRDDGCMAYALLPLVSGQTSNLSQHPFLLSLDAALGYFSIAALAETSRSELDTAERLNWYLKMKLLFIQSFYQRIIEDHSWYGFSLISHFHSFDAGYFEQLKHFLKVPHSFQPPWLWIYCFPSSVVFSPPSLHLMN